MSFLSDLATQIKTFVNTKVSAIIPSQTGSSGKYLTTNGTTISWATVSTPASTVTTGTSLTLDMSTYDIYDISLSASASFTLSNAIAGKFYEIPIKNTSTGTTITVTLPSGNIYRSQTFTISPLMSRVFTVRYINSKYYWLVSDELSNA